jgi:5'-methylthioadenosine phosphorylase
MVKIGIIGGSGLDNPDILQAARDIEVSTPFGKPTSKLKIGQIQGVDVVLIARHGRDHSIPPTAVNFRANIHALKGQGCTHILATSACGSLRQEIGRGDFVILDQFIDFTRHRPITFFETFPGGSEHAKHTAMADPFSEHLRNVLIHTAREKGVKVHEKGTVITIEGPRFSTRAESRMFRLWGADVINMSIAPEAILANEAGIPYAVIAMSTDYDCWKEDEPPVQWGDLLEIFKQNVSTVTELLVNSIPKIEREVAP